MSELELVVVLESEFKFNYDSPKSGVNLELMVMAVDGKHLILVPITDHLVKGAVGTGSVKVDLSGKLGKAFIDREGTRYPGLNPDVGNTLVCFL